MFAAQPQPAPEPAPQPAVVDPAQVQPPAPALQPQPAPAPQPPAEPSVPLHVLIEERKERQAYQAQLRQLIEAQQRAMQPPPQPIDPVADPEGFARAVLERQAATERMLAEQAVHQRANMSEMLARREHGNEKVDQALQAAVQAGLNRNFLMQPDPYGALLAWHNAQAIASQVGPDLKAWEAKKEAEILAKYGIKPGATPVATASPAPAPQVPQVPPSLTNATRANLASPVVESANDFFNQMMTRKR